MTRAQKYAFSMLSAVVAASGIAYLWMKYMMATDDPFAVVNHPWQPAMLHAHVLAAPAFLVLFGVIWQSHVAGRVTRPVPNRISGLFTLGAVAIMTASGYLLQVFTADLAWRICFAAHLGSGAVFAVAYIAHLVAGARAVARERAAGRSEAA
jgi:hypothetical protein